MNTRDREQQREQTYQDELGSTRHTQAKSVGREAGTQKHSGDDRRFTLPPTQCVGDVLTTDEGGRRGPSGNGEVEPVPDDRRCTPPERLGHEGGDPAAVGEARTQCCEAGCDGDAE
jgi:hypothetical protein